MTRIFISYSRVDKVFAEQFIRTIGRKYGHDNIWYDDKIPGGVDFWEQILKEIALCDIFIYLLSNDSVESPYCQAEFAEARRLQKPVVTLQVRDRTKLDDRLGNIQYIDLTPGSDVAEQYTRLYATIDDMWANRPTRRRKALWEPPTPKPKSVSDNPRPTDDPDKDTPTLRLPASITAQKPPFWREHLTQFVVAVISAVIGGLILAYLLGQGPFAPGGTETNTPSNTQVVQNETETPSDEPTLTSTPTDTPPPDIGCVADQPIVQPVDGQVDVTNSYAVGTLLSLYGKGSCPGGIRASRFVINDIPFGEDAAMTEQGETWILEAGITRICFEITNGDWAASPEACIDVEGILPTVTETPSNTPTSEPTNTEAPTNTPTTEPTITSTPDVQAAARTVIAEHTLQAIITESTATAAQATDFHIQTETESAVQTATATSWTHTPTVDFNASVEALLTEWENATPTADSRTDTPTSTNTADLLSTLQYASTPVSQNADWHPIEQNFNGVTMVLVPAGCFMMGSTDEQLAYALGLGAEQWVMYEQPAHEQCFDKPFWIDKYEVTNKQFASLGGDAEHESYFHGDNYPRESITWFEARDFCAVRGVRLPTEVEWEYAARGPDSLIFPWGNLFDSEQVVYFDDSSGSKEVGSKLGGVSWVGSLDLSGGVSEWVSSLYRPYEYNANDGREDISIIAPRIFRGGSWANHQPDFLRASMRIWINPDEENNGLGFRCARNFE